MSKKELKIDDREIVSQGLSIWMSCIASDPELLNLLYDDFTKLNSENAQIDQSLKFASMLVEKGVTSSDYKLRESFAGAIKFVVESIKSPKLKETPLVFFLRLLLDKIPYVQ